jgi:Imidazolonepropionase and related amidohydrolases
MKLQPGTTVVKNGQLVDGTGRPAIPNASVIITDGIISYAGPAADAPPTPPEARVIDAVGGTIMPGLIEAHIHLTYFNVSELQDLDIKFPVDTSRCSPP